MSFVDLAAKVIELMTAFLSLLLVLMQLRRTRRKKTQRRGPARRCRR